MEFFKSKLYNIDGAGNIGEELLVIIKEKLPTNEASNNTSVPPAVEGKAHDDTPSGKAEQVKN